ncbi:dihydrofolate reductase [Clostridium akagii]|uniref:dihydrofolate reductase n=1 Tax=Clostridium akagii TaxID=91623 RepID=UPI00047E3384|nr:dihydrofolate reductase [Clostridium akagii]
MLSIIVAFNENYVIGNQNKLIWHISNDLKRFKKITTGKTIVMGRKTFESLPGVLPGRKHIVITENKEYTAANAMVTVVNDIKEIFKYEDSSEEFFIIGGGEIYKQLLPYCKRLYLTKIVSTQEGDTYFPKFDINKYRVIEEENNVENNVEYSFIVLEKI